MSVCSKFLSYFDILLSPFRLILFLSGISELFKSLTSMFQWWPSYEGFLCYFRSSNKGDLQLSHRCTRELSRIIRRSPAAATKRGAAIRISGSMQEIPTCDIKKSSIGSLVVQDVMIFFDLGRFGDTETPFRRFRELITMQCDSPCNISFTFRYYTVDFVIILETVNCCFR